MKQSNVVAGDLMTAKVQWVESTQTLRAATASMCKSGNHCLLVRPTAEGRLPGIIASKDIVRILRDEDLTLLDSLTVADLMSRPAVCVDRGMNIFDCINLMQMAGVRRVPVLDGTEVVGVLSSTDVFMHIGKMATKPSRALSARDREIVEGLASG